MPGDLVALPVPTVSVLLGEGAGGGALALLPADRSSPHPTHGWPRSAEGASLIVFRDTDHADVMARRQGIEASALAAGGFVDTVVDEGDPARDPEGFARAIGAAITSAIAEAQTIPEARRRADRAARFAG